MKAVYSLMILLLFVLVMHANVLMAQTNQSLILEFQPVYGKLNLKLNDSWYKLNQNDSVLFEEVKFYISELILLNNNEIIWKDENFFHLINFENENTLAISIPLKLHFNTIKFNLGIDSITNVSGAMGGDLDPTKGMYWTWQSGYINLKMEGKSNLCSTRNNEFQFHLGGYQYPENALQTIILPVKESDETIIQLDLKSIIEKIDLSKINHIMSPGNEAIRISEIIKNAFSIQSQ